MCKVIAVLIVEVMKALYEQFKKPPEVKQKEADDEKVRNNLDAINNGSDGFRLPPDAASDNWGASIAEAGTRMEPGQDDGIKRQTDSRAVHDG